MVRHTKYQYKTIYKFSTGKVRYIRYGIIPTGKANLNAKEEASKALANRQPLTE